MILMSLIFVFSYIYIYIHIYMKRNAENLHTQTIYFSIYLSIYPSIYLSIYLSGLSYSPPTFYLCVHFSLYLPLKGPPLYLCQFLLQFYVYIRLMRKKMQYLSYWVGLLWLTQWTFSCLLNCFLCVMLRTEHRTQCKLGKHSISELHPQHDNDPFHVLTNLVPRSFSLVATQFFMLFSKLRI
jgi:hypothetical protein